MAASDADHHPPLRSAGCALCLLGWLALAGCEPAGTPAELDAEPRVAAGVQQVVVAERGELLAADEHAVYAIDRDHRWRRVYQAPAGSNVQIELAPAGSRFGVYERDRFRVYERDGDLAGELEALPAGFRHKLIGDGGRVLSPLVEPGGTHDDRVVALRIREPGGRELARLDAPARFTRLGERQLVAALPEATLSYTLDGALRWRLPVVAHELALARFADRVALVDATDTRRVLQLAHGVEIGRVELRDPVWTVALAPHGEHSAVGTRRRLHLFTAGVLRRTIALDLAYAVSLAVADDGRVLVGGHDREQRGQTLCYAPDGRLLARAVLERDDHAFRPEVRFLDATGTVARTASGLVYGVCPEVVR